MSDTATRFGVLGPTEARFHGEPIDLGPLKRRVLLARLLLDRGRPVSVERLCQDLWPDEVRPSGAVSTVRAHISRLRAVLEPHRAPGTPATVLVRDAAGYTLCAPRAALDSAVFEDLLSRARALVRAGRSEEALPTVEDALRLWRGPALHDAGGHDFAAVEVSRLQSLRQTAEETRVATLLKLGQADAAVPLAEALTTTAPLREVSWALLMQALYASGRSAEALRQYERFRVGLAEELGVDPGANLRRLHLAILHEDSDAVLCAPRSPAPRPGAPTCVGRRIDSATALLPLVGRDTEVEVITAALERADGYGVRWVVVSGMRGSGRTRLLEEAAGLAARRGFHVARLTCRCDTGSHPDAADVLAPAVHVLEQLTGEDGDTDGPASRPPWTEEAATTALVRKLAEHRTLLLADDVDTLCPSCRLLLRRLAVLLHDEVSLILCSAGRCEDPATAALLTDLPHSRTVQLTLSPLTADDVHKLLRHLDDTPHCELPENSRALYRRSEGNALVLTELLRLPARERLDARHVPPAIVRSVRARLDRLPEEAADMIVRAAAHGEVLDFDVLTELLAVPRERLLTLVEIAVNAELAVWHGPSAGHRPRHHCLDAGRYRFPGVLREAVLRTLTPFARRRLHTLIAAMPSGVCA